MTYKVEQIVFDIVSVIESDPELESFDVILAPIAKTSSPVFHVQHNLGLESWCIKNLYSYAHPKALSRTSDWKSQISLLTVAMLINPHVKTFWNMRRELVLQKKLHLLAEMKYAAVVLSFKPKAQDAFNYRKWLLREIWEQQISYSLLDELAVVLRAAEHHQNNHIAWDHCSWLLDFCQWDPDTLVAFWTSLEQWINAHVSDASAMNFQQQLIKKLIDNGPRLAIDFKRQIASHAVLIDFDGLSDNDLFVIGILLHDFELTESLITFYRDHEALWYHRRFLSHFWSNVLPEKVSAKAREILSKDGAGMSNALFSRMHEKFLSIITGNDHVHVKRFESWLEYLHVKVS